MGFWGGGGFGFVFLCTALTGPGAVAGQRAESLLCQRPPSRAKTSPSLPAPHVSARAGPANSAAKAPAARTRPTDRLHIRLSPSSAKPDRISMTRQPAGVATTVTNAFRWPESRTGIAAKTDIEPLDRHRIPQNPGICFALPPPRYCDKVPFPPPARSSRGNRLPRSAFPSKSFQRTLEPASVVLATRRQILLSCFRCFRFHRPSTNGIFLAIGY